MARTEGSARILAGMRDLHARMAGLAARDPKNVTWARTAVVIQARLAELLLQAGRAGSAREEVQAAVARLRELHAANQANKTLGQALTRALLVSADVDNAAGDGAAARTACRGVVDLLGPDAPASRDYYVLEPWVRANYCLGQDVAAGQTAGRLKSFGFADRGYLQFLALQSKTKGKS